ncbi:YdcH family protein [Microbulbifer sp. M83]|uniref:YdcH family protein n=1 Tax=Microbulbifer sp. M83 TaxID=3118246 RepID=UPI002FE01293
MPFIEAHTLEHDFPEYAERIRQLYREDLEFKLESEHYHQLDKKIRGLEASGITTDDENFYALKRERVQLKDHLYQQIVESSTIPEPG